MARRKRKAIRHKIIMEYGAGFAMIADKQIRDNRFKTFINLSKQNVVMGYDCDYAMFVHENMPNPPAEKNYTKSNTGPKYLERAIQEKWPEARKAYTEIVRHMRDSGGKGFTPEAWMDPAAREEAAKVIMDYSKNELVPVDTGNLRESAYIHIEGDKGAGGYEPPSAAKFVEYKGKE